MASLNLIQQILLWFLPVFLAVTVHEIAHGLVALRLGDQTAKLAGRLSLNPIKHLTPIGSFVVPGLFLLFSNFIFGWAKPVPVNQQQLHHPRRDMILVALAGPLSNLLMSIIWALSMKLGLWLSLYFPLAGEIIIYMGAAGVFINAAIMMLNILPLPPLDGGRILIGIMPQYLSDRFKRIEPFGMPVLLVLIFSGMAAKLIWPMMIVAMAVATHVSSLPVGLLTDALRVLFA